LLLERTYDLRPDNTINIGHASEFDCYFSTLTTKYVSIDIKKNEVDLYSVLPAGDLKRVNKEWFM